MILKEGYFLNLEGRGRGGGKGGGKGGEGGEWRGEGGRGYIL